MTDNLSATTVGAAAGKAIAKLTASRAPSASSPAPRPIHGAPITVEECAALKAWAESLPADRATPATSDQIARHLSFMAATLPSKNVDEDAGKMKAAVYCRLLDGYSNAALSFMARTACETLDWLPTPRQCLAILKDYRPPDTERDQALLQCHQFTQARFEAWIGHLKSEDATLADLDGMPERWLRIAYEQDVLRRPPEGGYDFSRPKQIDQAA